MQKNLEKLSNPCFEYCYVMYGKSYTKECDNKCEYARVVKCLKEVLRQHRGRSYCKNYATCAEDTCNKCENYQLDFEKINKSYHIEK